MQKQHRNLTYLILSALFAAMMGASALLKIPTAGVEITLQTLFVMLSGALLGPKYGTLSVLLYLAMGLLGIPVFTKGGGPAYVLEVPFGYLVGFIPCACLSGILTRQKTHIGALFLGFIVSLLPVYLFGAAHFYLISHFYLGRSLSFSSLLIAGVFVFLPVDVLSCLLGAWITKTVPQNFRHFL